MSHFAISQNTTYVLGALIRPYGAHQIMARKIMARKMVQKYNMSIYGYYAIKKLKLL